MKTIVICSFCSGISVASSLFLIMVQGGYTHNSLIILLFGLLCILTAINYSKSYENIEDNF